MITSIDRVWAKIKKRADDLARYNQFISPATAAEIVREIFRSEHEEATEGAVEVLASQLIALTNERHSPTRDGVA